MTSRWTLRLLFTLLVILGYVNASSASSTDSLRAALTLSKIDTEKVTLLNSLSSLLCNAYPDSALGYAKEARQISENNHYEKGTIAALLRIGDADLKLNKLTDALKIFKEAQGICEKTNDLKGLGESLNWIGTIYYNQREIKTARTYYEKSLQIAEKLNNDLLKALTLNNLGSIDFEEHQFESARNHFERALHSYELLNQSNFVATIYLNIGLVYKEEGKEEESYRSYQKIFQLDSNKVEKNILMNAYLNISEYFRLKKQFKESVANADSSLAIALTLKATGDLPYIYKTYVDIYTDTKEYAKALQYFQLYTDWKDSTLNENNSKMIHEIETKYETEKKDIKITLLNTENQNKQIALSREVIVRNIVLVGFIIVVILLFFIYKIYAQKRDINIELAKKNLEIEDQRQLLENVNEKMLDSINYAKYIQESFLRSESDVQKHLPEFFILNRPKDIVSGDFYWFSQQGTKSIIAVVDCTGHGVPGAFMSMMGNTLLNEIVNTLGTTDPAQILDKLHKGVYYTLQQNQSTNSAQDGMDIAICVYDHTTRELSFAGAHNPIYIVQTKPELIKADAVSIGGSHAMFMGTKKGFTTKVIDCKSKTEIYLFSDGFIDQFGGPKRKKFGYDNFEAMLREVSDLPMQEQKMIFEKQFDQWKGNQSQIDDVLVMGIKIT